MKFSGKVGDGPVHKRLNFGGDLDHGCKLILLLIYYFVLSFYLIVLFHVLLIGPTCYIISFEYGIWLLFSFVFVGN